MSLSDFPSSIARVRAGECPLCGGELGIRPFSSDDPNWCAVDDVKWWIYGVHDPLPEHGQAFGLGPMLVPSRKLTEDEARKIFARPVEESS